MLQKLDRDRESPRKLYPHLNAEGMEPFIVTRVVVLDTGPLGLLTSPRQTSEVVTCSAWLRSILAP
jgi:hypothetical protein